MEKDHTINILDHGYVKYISHMGSDESIIESARMSTNKGFQGWDKDINLLDYLYRNQHMSPFEMPSLIIETKMPIFVVREFQRHRTFCLSGDTNIYIECPRFLKKKKHQTYKITIKDIYKKWNNDELFGKKCFGALEINRNRIKNMKIRCLNENTNEFEFTTITDVIKSEPKHMFKIILNDGKSITCSADHKFIFEDGWKSFAEAINLQLVNNKAVYDNKKIKIKVNGIPCYKDKDWLFDKYHTKQMRVYEISEKYNINYNTLRKWLRVFDLQKKNSFPKGHEPWNLGKTYKSNMVVSEEHKEKIREARSGSKSNFWKGGISSDRANNARWTREQASKVHKKYNFTCQNCGQNSSALVAHHIISVWMDETKAYDFNNLITVCKSCHKQMAFREHEYIEKLTGRKANKLEYEKKKKEIYFKNTRNRLVGKFVEIKSIEYIGKEDSYDLSVSGPFHNFIANGIITHNSFNELSARYSKMPNEHYIPEPDRIKRQSTKNNQGSSEEGFNMMYIDGIRDILGKQQDEIYGEYEGFIKSGVAKEIARLNTPVSRYSKMRAKANLRNWLHFLDLRMRENAQWEIRQFANAIASIIKELFPKTYSLFEEYTLYSTNVSRTELKLLKMLLISINDKDNYKQALINLGINDENRLNQCIAKIYGE